MRLHSLALVAILMVGCRLPDTNINNYLNNVSGPSGSNPSSSPSPGAQVSTVRVGEFNRECIASPTPGELRVGCVILITCTPLDAGGNDVGGFFLPAWTESGLLGVQPTSQNPYNARAACSGVGFGTAICTVGGKSGAMTIQCTAS